MAKTSSTDIPAWVGIRFLKSDEGEHLGTRVPARAGTSTCLFLAPETEHESVDPGFETQCHRFFFAVVDILLTQY